MKVTYSWPRSEKKTSRLAALAGERERVSRPRRPRSPPRALALGSSSRPVARARRPDALDLEVDRRTARRRPAPGPPAWRMRPQFGSPPWSARLDERRVGDRARDRLDGVGPPRTSTRPTRRRALAVGDDLDRELAQQRVERLAERELVGDSGSTRTPDAPLASTNTVSLVESWPSTVIRSNERFDAHAGQQVERRRRRARRRSRRSRASSRSRGEIIPAPLACAREPDGAGGSAHLEAGALRARVGGQDRLARSRRRRRAERGAAPRAGRRAPCRAAARCRSRRSRRRRPASGSMPSAPAAAACIAARGLDAALAVADVRVAAVRRRRRAARRAAPARDDHGRAHARVAS